MVQDSAALKRLLYWLADAAGFLFASPLGLSLVAGAVALALGLSVGAALTERRLLFKAAGEAFGLPQAIATALRAFGAAGLKAAAALPALAVLAAVLVLLLGLADATRRVDDFLATRARVAELSATVKNLERRYKAAEVRVLSAKEGLIDAEIAFFATKDPSKPAKTQSLRLRGRELFVDAIVCNFAYSEIASGSAVNLAIPYRVFSDEVPQAEGIELELLDPSGLPLMYKRSPDELYGIAPAAFDRRLAELVGMLRREESARAAGIVRSVYGNAVHRRVRTGDVFIVWVEQSGGLTIKDAYAF